MPTRTRRDVRRPRRNRDPERPPAPGGPEAGDRRRAAAHQPDLHDGIIQSIYAVSLSLEDVPELIDEEPPRRRPGSIGPSTGCTDDRRTSARSSSDCGRSAEAGLAGLWPPRAELLTASVVELELDLLAAGRLAALTPRPAELTRSREGAQQRRPPAASRATRLPLAPVRATRDPARGSRTTGGFDTRQRLGSGHFGLANTARPCRGGRLGRSTIESAPGKGTRIIVPAAPTRLRRSGRLLTRRVPPAPCRLRLLIVDDHEVVRQGLVALLGRRREFQVVAEAGTVAEAIEQARRFQPGHRRHGRPAARTAPGSRPAARSAPSSRRRAS